MRFLPLAIAVFCGVLSSPACGKAPALQVNIPDGCNPIGADSDCLLPYPSDFFRSVGADGPHLVISPAATVKFGSNPVDFLRHRPDGFSVGSPILALFPEGIDDHDLVFWKEGAERSREASSPTVVLDAETGERVLHFAEIDPRADTDARRALIIRPLVRLENGHRYIVGIHGLRNKSGGMVTPPKGFLNLLDNDGSGNPKLAAVARHYKDDIFPKLAAAGVDRSSLQLAWDFTTESEASATRDMLDMRSDLLGRLAATPPTVKIVSVEDNPAPKAGEAPTIGRRIEATVTVPLYVDSDKPGASLVYDNNGKVTPNGTTDVPFTIWIPLSVTNRKPGDRPARLLQFGHGFLGNRYEVNDFPAQFANEKGFVIVAADWWGLSKDDLGPIANAIASSDPASMLTLTDRIHQAMANFISVAAAAKGPLASMPELAVSGAPAYDPSQLYYYGISAGGVLGGVYVSLSPYVDRAALSVAGMNWSMMMFRSAAFAGLFLFINIQQPDPLEQQKFAALFQSAMERIDGMEYAPHMLANRYPMNPPTLDLAMQNGLGDAAVPNIASFFEARTLGVPVLEPSPVIPFGLTSVQSPASGAAMTLFDFGVQQTDLAEWNLSPNPVHEGVRRAQGSKDQVDQFFHPGAPITQTCGGPCVVTP